MADVKEAKEAAAAPEGVKKEENIEFPESLVQYEQPVRLRFNPVPCAAAWTQHSNV